MFHTRVKENGWSWNHNFGLAYISSQLSINKTGFSCLTSCFELYYPTSGSNSGFNPTARAESQPLLLLHGRWSGLGSARWKAAKENQHAINKSVFTLVQAAVWRSIVRMTFLEPSLLSAVMQQDYHPGAHLKCLSHTCQTSSRYAAKPSDSKHHH